MKTTYYVVIEMTAKFDRLLLLSFVLSNLQGIRIRQTCKINIINIKVYCYTDYSVASSNYLMISSIIYTRYRHSFKFCVYSPFYYLYWHCM